MEASNEGTKIGLSDLRWTVWLPLTLFWAYVILMAVFLVAALFLGGGDVSVGES